MATLISQFAGPLLALLGVLAGIIAAFFAGHAKGKAKAEVKAAEQRSADNDALAAESIKRTKAASDQQVKVTVESNDIDEAVHKLSDDDLFNELRNGPDSRISNR